MRNPSTWKRKTPGIAAMLASTMLFGVLFAQNTPNSNSDAGSIAGKLLSQDGTPAVGVRVSVSPADNSTPENANTLITITQTDSSGRYRLDNVRPGRYIVVAGLVDTPSYFPGVNSRAGATVITVGARDALAGIDFRMTVLQGLRFSGHVIRQNGDGSIVPAAPAGAAGPPFQLVVGAPGAQIAQIRITGGPVGAATTVSAPVAPDGSFEFSSLRPGRYDLIASQPAQRVSVTLTDKDITDFQLIVPLIVTVTGTVSVEGGGLLPRFQMDLLRKSVPATPPQGAPLASNPRININPTFISQLPSGEYSISVSGLPAGFTLKSATSGSTDLSLSSLMITDTGVPPLKIVLGVSSPAPWVTLSGHVVGRVERYRVVNFNISSQTAAGELEPIFYMDGSFEFPKALPGQYMVRTSTLGSATINSTITAGNAGSTDGVIYVPDDLGITAADPSGTVKVRGHISGHAKATSGARVRLSIDAMGEKLVAPVYMDGSFEFPHVPPGTYRADVYPEIPGATAKTVVVGNVDLQDLTITVPDTRDIPGRILIQDRTPSMPRNVEFSVDGHGRLRTPLQPDGSFLLTVPQDRKLDIVSSALPTGYTVESMKYGSLDLMSNPIRFSDSSANELVVTLRAPASKSTVNGSVAGFESLPTGSHVWLTDNANILQPLETDIRVNGTFAFTGVPSGKYSALLSAPGIPSTTSAAIGVDPGRNVDGIRIVAPRPR